MSVQPMHPLPRGPIVKRLDKRARSEPVNPAAPAPAATSITAQEPDPVMAQAKKDLDAGMVDTDMRATPGLDAQRRAKLVPGPGGKPPAR